MAPPRIRAKTEDGLSDLPKLEFLDVSPGTPSAAVTWRCLNDNSEVTVDAATEVRVGVRQIDQATGEAVLNGFRAVDERWLELKATGSGNDNSIVTPWTPVGRGRYLILPQLDGGEYHELQIRYNPPATAPSGEVEFKLEGEGLGRLTALEQGHTEGARDGIVSGVGDHTYSEIIEGSAPTANATPDDKVNVPDLSWLIEGRPWNLLAHSLTLSDQDASSSTLGAGESYWATLSLAADGTITVTKSDKGSPPDPSTIPDAPAGEVLYCVIERLYAGIDDTEIDYRATLARFAYIAASGLDVTIGKGLALVDNSILRIGVATQFSLTASATNYLWLVSDADGQFSVTTSPTPPSPRAYLLWEFTTDSSDVTAVVDKRDPIGAEMVAVEFSIDGALSAGEDVQVFRGRRPGYVTGRRAIVASLVDPGSGNSAGETRFELWKSDGAGGWTTLFSSKATDDRRPLLSHDTVEPILATYLEDGVTLILAEELEIDPMSRLRLTTDEPEAYDGTAPTGARVVLLVEMG